MQPDRQNSSMVRPGIDRMRGQGSRDYGTHFCQYNPNTSPTPLPYPAIIGSAFSE